MPYTIYHQIPDQSAPESAASILTFPEDLTEIPEKAVAFNEKITHVILHDNIKKIGKRAFHYCKNLRHVFLPDGLECIDEEAFKNCSRLTALEIPDSVTHIGKGAFKHCKKLTSLSLPSSLSVISDEMLMGCRSLTVFTTPKGTKEIGVRAFSSCSSLQRISITNGVQEIKEYTFEYCYRLCQARLPESIVRIRTYAFFRCYELTHITNTKCIKEIESNAFFSCENLSHFSIGTSIQSISRTAFQSCDNLHSIELFGIKIPVDQLLQKLPLALKLNQALSSETTKNISDIVLDDDYDFFKNAFREVTVQNLYYQMEPLIHAVVVSHYLKYRDQPCRDFLALHFDEMFCFLITHDNTDAACQFLEMEEFVTNENVDLFIEHAIEHGRLELQTLLMRYKDEHFGYHMGDLFTL